ncbi:MAG TPA: N-acetyltransferase [Terriglobales bacterium]|nr:N-acetyltransferase [Terriglobales bacterium]
MRTRKATLPDAQAIYQLVHAYSGDGTLLPRAYSEVCENIRDFVVVEDKKKIIGCGALHLYGPHLAEVRSIAVSPAAQGRGAGHRVVRELLLEAERHRVSRVCLFTRIPEFFSQLGFTVASREELPDKIFKDCLACPRLHNCDEVAMVHGEAQAESALRRPGYSLVQIGK